MKEYRITVSDSGEVDFWEGEFHTGPLTRGELMEQVFCMIHPKLKYEQYPMMTTEAWESRFRTPLGAQAEQKESANENDRSRNSRNVSAPDS